MKTHSHTFTSAVEGRQLRSSVQLHGDTNVILRFDTLNAAGDNRIGEPIMWGFPTLEDWRGFLAACLAFEAELSSELESELEEGYYVCLECGHWRSYDAPPEDCEHCRSSGFRGPLEDAGAAGEASELVLSEPHSHSRRV